MPRFSKRVGWLGLRRIDGKEEKKISYSNRVRCPFSSFGFSKLWESEQFDRIPKGGFSVGFKALGGSILRHWCSGNNYDAYDN